MYGVPTPTLSRTHVPFGGESYRQRRTDLLTKYSPSHHAGERSWMRGMERNRFSLLREPVLLTSAASVLERSNWHLDVAAEFSPPRPPPTHGDGNPTTSQPLHSTSTSPASGHASPQHTQQGEELFPRRDTLAEFIHKRIER